VRATIEAVSGGVTARELEPTDLSAVVYLPSARQATRDGTPGGLSLLDRQLKQLRALAVERVWVLLSEEDAPPPAATGCVVDRFVLVPGRPRTLIDALVAAPAVLPEAFLATSADRLVDRRVFAALLRKERTVFASVDGVTTEPIAWVYAEDLRRAGTALAVDASRLPLASLDPYVAELRGTASPYVLAVETATERRTAWRILLDSVQKRALDLPGRYFDTPFENALVRRLAPTRVTPNQITLLTLVVAAVVAGLFLQGWLRVGVVLALVVGVLDGVDGKLARLKLATSKLGELEHVGDFFYENAWYLALATHFQGATLDARYWMAGVALVGLDLTDSLLYLVLQRRTGRMLDEVTPFDRRFRAVAGRRNVYVAIFVVGFFTGHGAHAFLVAVTWAALTVIVHAARVAWLTIRPTWSRF
jgi:1L-myo-inositol 1-phosphate cytidylyltransferase / CDP-L-myo-inositol myo-inositolphosphotransferase